MQLKLVHGPTWCEIPQAHCIDNVRMSAAYVFVSWHTQLVCNLTGTWPVLQHCHSRLNVMFSVAVSITGIWPSDTSTQDYTCTV